MPEDPKVLAPSTAQIIGEQPFLFEIIRGAPHSENCARLRRETCDRSIKQHHIIAMTPFCSANMNSHTFFVPMRCDCWKAAAEGGKP